MKIVRLPSVSEIREKCHQNYDSTRLLRRISANLTRFLVITPFSANQITIFGTVLFIIGICLFTTDNYLLAFIGSIIACLSLILDYVDGDIARYKGTAGFKGKVLDVKCHTVEMICLVILLTIGVYRYYPRADVILVGVAALLFTLIRRILRHINLKAEEAANRRLENGETLQKEVSSGLISNIARSNFKNAFLLKIGSISSYIVHPEHFIPVLVIVSTIDLVLSHFYSTALDNFNAIYAALVLNAAASVLFFAHTFARISVFLWKYRP